MKILEIDYDYYMFPEGICSIEEFIAYANDNFHSFVALTQFETENCAFPYLIADDTRRVYRNIAAMEKIAEAEATVLPREEYDRRLAQVVASKCIHCVHYEEDLEGDNLKGHRGKLSLDGECWGYQKKED